MTGFIASSENELEEAVNGAMACAGPSLIDARIDRSNYSDTVRAIRGSI